MSEIQIEMESLGFINGLSVNLGDAVCDSLGQDLYVVGSFNGKLICNVHGKDIQIIYSCDELHLVGKHIPAPCKPVLTLYDAIVEASNADNGERLKDCINNLLRQAAMGEEWATKLLFEKLDNGTPKV